jgi:hypothetical protein
MSRGNPFSQISDRTRFSRYQRPAPARRRPPWETGFRGLGLATAAPLGEENRLHPYHWLEEETG